MQRYFVRPEQIIANTCLIEGGDLHHIRDVLRYVPGQEVIISITGGLTYQGIIKSISKYKCILDLKDVIHSDKPDYSLTVAQALIKKDRFELFLEKSTEFGVTRIIPTIFSRSIVKIDNENETKKLERYQLIVKEASEQSQRFQMPEVVGFVKLKDLDYGAYDKILVCYEQEEVTSHINKLLPSLSMKEKILIIVGPEGGITFEEAQFLKTKNTSFVSLGHQILRSESAAILILAAFMYEWGI